MVAEWQEDTLSQHQLKVQAGLADTEKLPKKKKNKTKIPVVKKQQPKKKMKGSGK